MNFFAFLYDYVLPHALVIVIILAALWAIYIMIFGKSVPRWFNSLTLQMKEFSASNNNKQPKSPKFNLKNPRRASDKVVYGDYIGLKVSGNSLHGYDETGEFCSVPLSKQTVYRFDFIDKRLGGRKALKTYIDYNVSKSLFGDIGAFHAYQNAERHAIFYALIIFKDGKQSVLQLSERNYNRLNKLFS